ncbi:hypothetical protein LSPH24S_04753 [Lysinibacillus sphaericus]
MTSKVLIESNAYHDSVTLMSLSSKINRMDGVEQAVVSMATEMNKELLENIGLLTDEAKVATGNDLIIALITDTDERAEEVITLIHTELTSKKVKKGKDNYHTAKTLTSALHLLPNANMAIISVPGKYAARKALKSLYVSPSMPVHIIENRTHGNRTINEGLGKVLRFGAFSSDVIDRLKWLRDVFAPAMKKALVLTDGIDLKAIIAQALHMGDECHNRNKAATSLFY